jgi:hypothetical protein
MHRVYQSCLCFSLLLGIATVTTLAQNAPLISGAAGFVSSTDGGQTFLQPVIAPVAVLPIGEHLLVESRADLRGFYQRRDGNGPYVGTFIATLEYLQLDYTASSWLTVSAGRYLTPFGIYNERLTPIWIRDFQDAPLLFPLGTRTTGSSDGAMARGILVSAPLWNLTYASYFSSSSNAEQFQSGRAAGARASIFVPGKRLEVGASYQRFLQGTHLNSIGAHMEWQPWRVPVDTRAEYAHSPSGYGYWIEAAYRLPQSGSSGWLSRLQPVFRMQQFVRNRQISGDSLPTTDTQRADFGLNYYLPHEVRLNTSYSRQFTALGDRNVWNVAATYRFLLPVNPGGKH